MARPTLWTQDLKSGKIFASTEAQAKLDDLQREVPAGIKNHNKDMKADH